MSFNNEWEFNKLGNDPLYPIVYYYHSNRRPSVEFYGGEDDGSNLFLGVELEVDSRQYTTNYLILPTVKYSNELFKNSSYLYYMSDGSLVNGFEMISQPATYNYHLSIADKYESLFNKIKENGFKADGLSTCGFHIHFNRSYFQNGEKSEDDCVESLLYLFQKYWKDIVLFSRRDYNHLSRWAGKYYDDPKTVVDKYKDGNHRRHMDRYHAVNLVNKDTIEFRVFKGTLDVDTFYATLEFVKNIVTVCKNRSKEEIEKMPFEALITSKNLIRYNNKQHRKTALNKLPSELW